MSMYLLSVKMSSFVASLFNRHEPLRLRLASVRLMRSLPGTFNF